MQSDRFAREIVGILTLSNTARSRRLMRNPLGGPQASWEEYTCGGSGFARSRPCRARPARRPRHHTPLPRAALPRHYPRAATRLALVSPASTVGGAGRPTRHSSRRRCAARRHRPFWCAVSTRAWFRCMMAAQLSGTPLGRLSDRCWLMHQEAALVAFEYTHSRLYCGVWRSSTHRRNPHTPWKRTHMHCLNPQAPRKRTSIAPSQPANTVEGSAYAPSQPADIVEANPYAQWRRANTVEAREYARWHAPDVRKRKAGPYHTEPAQPATQADAAARPANAGHFVTRSRHQRGSAV